MKYEETGLQCQLKLLYGQVQDSSPNDVQAPSWLSPKSVNIVNQLMVIPTKLTKIVHKTHSEGMSELGQNLKRTILQPDKGECVILMNERTISAEWIIV